MRAVLPPRAAVRRIGWLGALVTIALCSTWSGLARVEPLPGQGAQHEPHWSFVAPVRPDPPPVKNAAWVRNPIDAFILERLEREGLKPSRRGPTAPRCCAG